MIWNARGRLGRTILSLGLLGAIACNGNGSKGVSPRDVGDDDDPPDAGAEAPSSGKLTLQVYPDTLLLVGKGDEARATIDRARTLAAESGAGLDGDGWVHIPQLLRVLDGDQEAGQ